MHFNPKKQFSNGLLYFLGSIIISLTCFILSVTANPPDSPYAPGATLSPSCAPGDPNCTVYAPLVTTLTSTTTVTLGNYALNFDSGTLYLDPINNRVGIGTTSPSYALDVTGDIRATGNLITAGQTIGGDFNVTGNTVFGNATTSDILYLNSRVAATLIPTAANAMDIGDGSNWLTWRTGYFGTSIGISGTATSSGTQLISSRAYSIDSAGVLSLNTLNNQNIVIGSGNLGIGTTSPYSILSISNSASTAVNTPLFTIASTTAGVSTSTLMTVLANGNVGIGIATPTGKMHFKASSATYGFGGIRFEQNVNSNYWDIMPAYDSLYFGRNGTTYFWMNTSALNMGGSGGTPVNKFTISGNSYFNGGNVGIGTTSPYTKLSVWGSGTDSNKLFELANNASTTLMYAAENGNVYMPVSTATTTISGGLAVGSNALNVLQNGNVGIGTAAPNNIIQVANLINFNNTNYGTSLGYQAGYGNLSNGLYNTFLGYQAGYTATSTDGLTIIGYKAGYLQNNYGETNASSTFIGSFAGYSNTTGYQNTFIGAGAGYSNTAGYLNSAIGYEALHNNTTGFYNSAIGYEALYSNTGGYYNSAIGYKALYSNTDGYYNSAMGYQALLANITGSYNSAIGNNALISNNTGYYNVAIGNNALFSNITGSYNSAAGSYALYSNQTGYYNSVMGYDALYSNTSGYYNSVMGYNALYFNQTGSANTVLGTEAGYGVINNSFASSTLIGYRAGYGLTTGNNNIFLGYQAGDNLTTGASNIIIGYDIDAPLATSANTLNIGNLLFGTGINGIGTTLSSGNIGIGTTSPYAKLSVWGTGTGTDKIMELVDSASSTKMVVLENGNVGIGTASPSYKLEIAGSLYAQTATFSNPSTGIANAFNVYNGATSAIGNGSSITMNQKTSDATYNLTGAINGIMTDNNPASYDGAIFFKTATNATMSEKMRIDSSGNVGIGTTSPYAKFSVVGETVSEYFSATSTTATSTFAGGLSAAGSLYVLQNGDVGIGTVAPDTKLSIAQIADSNGIKIYGYDDRAGSYGRLSIDSSGKFNIDSNGTLLLNTSGDFALGYGTVNNMTVLDTKKINFGTDSDYSIAYNTINDSLQFMDGSTIGTNVKMAITSNGNLGIGTTSPYSVLSISNSASTAVNTPLFTIASTTAGVSTSTLMTILANGNVGIGTTSPGAMLDVNGNIKISGDTNYYLDLTQAGGTSGAHPIILFSNKTVEGYNSGINKNAGNEFFNMAGGSADSSIFGGGVNGDNYRRIRIRGGGDILFGSGSSAVDTYLSRSTTNTLKISSDGFTGSANLIITGNVGIGTSSPYSILSISNSASTAINTPLFTIASTTAGVSTSTLMTVLANGNVGIGTAAPEQLLNVSGQSGVAFTNTIAYQETLFTGYGVNGNRFEFRKARGNATVPAQILDNDEIFRLSGKSLYSAAWNFQRAGEIAMYSDGNTTAGGNPGKIAFLTSPTGSLTPVERLIIRQNGFVGIGTTSPYAKLSVWGTGTGTDKIMELVDSASSTKMVVLENGNVGIGIAAPGRNLVIQNTSANPFISLVSSVSGIPGILFGDTDSDVLSQIRHDNGNNSLLIYTNSYMRMLIAGNGNISIGTTSPYAKLSVWGDGTDSNRLFELINNASTTLMYAKEDGNVYMPVSTATTTISGGLAVGSNALNVLQNGYVGIGTAAPSTAFEVTSGTLKVSGGNWLTGTSYVTGNPFSSADTNSDVKFRLRNNSYDFSFQNSNSNELFVMQGAGNIGIGTTSPYSILSISNSASTAVNTPLFTIASTTAGVSTSTLMTVLANGNVGIGTSSPTGQLSLGTINNYGAVIKMSEAEGLAGGDLRIGLDESNRQLFIVDIGDIDRDFGQSAASAPMINIYNAGATSYARFANNTISYNSAFQITRVTDLSSGNALTINSSSGYELTDTDAEQAWLYIEPKINQSATANYVGLLMNVTETALGSGNNYLMDLRAGGATRFNIGSAGNVGIGTTSPYAKLSVWGTGTGTGKIMELVDSASSTKMVVLENGTVGIGTSTPFKNFVYEGTNSYFYIDTETSAWGPVIGGHGDSGSADILYFNGSLIARDSQTFVLGNSSDATFRWSAAGTYDWAELNIYVGSQDRTGYFLIKEGSDNRTVSNFVLDPTLRIYSADGTQANDYLEFYHNQTDAILGWGNGSLVLGNGIASTTFASSGNVGIGSSSPNYLLSMEGSNGGYYDAILHQWINGSVRAIKQDIELITEEEKEDLLAVLGGLNINKYRFISDVEKYGDEAIWQYGIIADESPNLLTGHNHDGVQSGSAIQFLLATAQVMNEKINNLSSSLNLISASSTAGSLTASADAGGTITNNYYSFPGQYSAILEKFAINKNGDLYVKKIKADTIETNVLIISNPDDSGEIAGELVVRDSIGSAIIATGTAEIFVETAITGTTSKIFITPTSLTTLTLSVTQKEKCRGFKVEISEPAESTIYFDWWIVQTEEVKAEECESGDFTNGSAIITENNEGAEEEQINTTKQADASAESQDIQESSEAEEEYSGDGKIIVEEVNKEDAASSSDVIIKETSDE